MLMLYLAYSVLQCTMADFKSYEPLKTFPGLFRLMDKLFKHKQILFFYETDTDIYPAAAFAPAAGNSLQQQEGW